MSQIIALLLAGLLCFGVTGCLQNTEETSAPDHEPAGTPVEQTAPDPVPLTQPLPAEEPEPETVWEAEGAARLSLLQTDYPVGTEKVTLVIENTGGTEIGYGLHFSLEKFTDGQWNKLDFSDELMFAEILCIVPPYSAGTMAVDWSILHKPLDEGLYRVTGSKLWIDQGDGTDPWQVDFRVVKDAQPEPDFALVIPNQPVSAAAEVIAVHFVNTTGEDGYVQDIPHLERLDDTGEWTAVPWADKAGFCGTPSTLPAAGRDWSEDAAYLWGTLEEGQYRLSYNVGREFKTEDVVYGGFTVCAPEICGYPTAGQFLQSHPLED